MGDVIWDSIFSFMYQGAMYSLGFVSSLIRINNDTVSTIFSNSAVIKFLSFLEIFGGLLFICGIGFAIADWAISSHEGNGDNIIDTFKNIIIGFITLLSFTTVPILLLQFTNECSLGLCNNLSLDVLFENFEKSTTDDSQSVTFMAFIISTIFVLIILISIVRVFLANIKRGGILVILMFICPVHIFSIPRGYTDAFWSWCKQVIGLCLTAFIQNFSLALSLLLTSAADNVTGPTMIAAIGIALAAFEAPRIMQQFGLDTSIRANVSQAIYATSGAISIVKSFA